MGNNVKYRLIRIITTNGLGEEKVRYHIQTCLNIIGIKIWLFCGVKCHYFTYKGKALLLNRYYRFESESLAKSVLLHLSTDRTFLYNGSLIVRVLDDHNLSQQVFINKSQYIFWNNSTAYEFHHTIEGLKRLIDQRKVITNKEVITNVG